MTGVNHGKAGLIVAVSMPFIYQIEPDMVVLTGGMCFIGSLFPDIDSPSSNISKYIPVLPRLINKLFGHRKLLHSPVFLILFDFFFYNILCNVISPEVLHSLLFGFSCGFLIHIGLDMLTIKGTPLFYPFSNKSFHLTKRKSGEKGEEIVMLIFCVIIIGIAFCWERGLIQECGQLFVLKIQEALA